MLFVRLIPQESSLWSESSFYAWQYDRPMSAWLYFWSSLLVVVIIACCLLPIAPFRVKVSVHTHYLQMAYRYHAKANDYLVTCLLLCWSWECCNEYFPWGRLFHVQNIKKIIRFEALMRSCCECMAGDCVLHIAHSSFCSQHLHLGWESQIIIRFMSWCSFQGDLTRGVCTFQSEHLLGFLCGQPLGKSCGYSQMHCQMRWSVFWFIFINTWEILLDSSNKCCIRSLDAIVCE